MRLGQNEKAVEVEAIPTGSLGLDIALGIGGLPRGPPRRRDLRAGIVRQDHARAASRGRGSEEGRHLRSSMPSMPSIRFMRASSGSISRTF
ncbi:MAG: hypothetical protein R3D01_05710 [Hyphomicrobiales bacterium]